MAERRPIFEFSAGGLVVDERGHVLLIRARDLRNRPVWTLPKGTLISGETSADAALREVREETGWRCELVRELEAVTYWFQRDGDRVRKTVRWYLVRLSAHTARGPLSAAETSTTEARGCEGQRWQILHGR